MSRFLARCNAALAHRLAGPLLLLALAAAYAWACARHPLFPGTDGAAAGKGWWTWSDQQRYLAEAAAVAQGRLDAVTLAYPVGYPALGALFWRWLPAHPFFVPNLLLVLAAAAAWWRLAVRWFTRVEALLVAVAFVATHRWLIGYTMVVPWNTIATQAALLGGIWLVVARRDARTVWLLGGLAAATYLVRPVDAVAFGPLLVCAVWRLDDARARGLHGAAAAGLVALGVGAAGWLNWRVFGHWRSPYETVSTQTIGFFSYPTAYKFHWLFVDGGPLFRETDPALLWRYPWLVLAVAGVVGWVRREGWAAVAAAAALGLNWLLYINYNDLLPSDLYRFTLIHYLAWGFPLLFLLAVAACRHGWRDRWGRAALVVSVALGIVALGWRMEERVLPAVRDGDGGWRLPAVRPLLVRFPGAPIERAAELRLEGRALVEYSQFVAPYVPSELQLLLGTRTRGERLSAEPGSALSSARPELAEMVWRWRITRERLGKLGERGAYAE